MEISKIYRLWDTNQLMPYLQVGTRYCVRSPRWRTNSDGRTRAGHTVALEREGARWRANADCEPRPDRRSASVYLSVGQNNLDIWEGKLNVSFVV